MVSYAKDHFNVDRPKGSKKVNKHLPFAEDAPEEVEAPTLIQIKPKSPIINSPYTRIAYFFGKIFDKMWKNSTACFPCPGPN